MEEIFIRGWENLVGRTNGPMNFRILMQPAVALFLAIRAGLKDAREGKPPFLWTIFSDPGQRQELLRQGWKDVGTVFIVALVLDAIYQVMEHPGIFTGELLITATAFALLPYLAARGLVTRIARWIGPRNKSADTPAADANSQVGPTAAKPSDHAEAE